eukprot:CAMPEP_0185022624 /NCGR_PEP_ID=MMETSP1103-20130426/5325_1 /TAXON_ID=36769 /ORGANISM="Paraphysomonas bandaiensis, Strain Caron Lab Isolate" /LENGTH=473 /DNA_ID=CAMNT_0027554773 /DNA_START=1 /DNA_END=1422 /DNA_ORIENTATION=-
MENTTLWPALGGLASVLLVKLYQNSKKRQDRSGLGVAHPSSSMDIYRHCVYLDYNATTPIWPEVMEAMKPFSLTCFGNPSSPHIYAAPCKNAVNTARNHISNLINSPDPSCIVVTSCGSESDNRAIDIALYNYSLRSTNNSELPHIITCSIEHPAVLEYLNYLKNEGKISLSVVGVSVDGIVSPDDIRSALQPNTALVTVMHSNNEVGTVQPINAIATLIREFNEANCTAVLFHSDAAQSMGKIPVDVQRDGTDMLTIVGHKFGAPKGIAALYLRPGVNVRPLLFGGGQEGGRRAGTENVMLMAGLGEAARIAQAEWRGTIAHMLTLRMRLIRILQEELGGLESGKFLRFNGPVEAYQLNYIATVLHEVVCGTRTENIFPVLPNTVNVSFRGVRAAKLMPTLIDKVACSAGTTCHAVHSSDAVSAVLCAMQLPREYGIGTLRLSFGRHTTEDEVVRAGYIIARSVKVLSIKKD